MGVSLDHWLNANTSLAVGSLNGVAPQLDSSGLGYLSLPLMSAPSLNTASDPSGVPRRPLYPTHRRTGSTTRMFLSRANLAV